MTNDMRPAAGPSTGVIVTGGASGIGRATAGMLAEAGRSVALWDINGEGAEAMAREIEEHYGVSAVGIGIDLSDTPAFVEAIDRSRAVVGSIGGLVHAAGAAIPGPIDDLTEEGWDRTLSVHLRAAALLIRDLVPDLRVNHHSAVVLISSIEGIVAHAGVPAYCSAKAGLLGLNRSSAARLGRFGIRVNAICPGFIATPMFLPSIVSEDARAKYEKRIPLGRIGEPEEIARTARFLLSTDASYITAAEIVVDGGVTRTTF